MNSDKLKEATEFSNYRMTLSNQISILNAKTTQLLYYSVNGGTFYIDRPLISFVDTLINRGYSEAVLLDINDIPVRIGKLDEFFDKIMSRYFESVNEYHNEYEKIKKLRSVKKIVDLDV